MARITMRNSQKATFADVFDLYISAVTARGVKDKTIATYKQHFHAIYKGQYLIGRDISAGTDVFFVVYGFGGKFDIGQYDSNHKVISGTWDFYWVGLKEDYEKHELLHVQCKEGYTIKITGSVVLKIARSQKVQIDL